MRIGSASDALFANATRGSSARIREVRRATKSGRTTRRSIVRCDREAILNLGPEKGGPDAAAERVGVGVRGGPRDGLVAALDAVAHDDERPEAHRFGSPRLQAL